MNLRTKLTALIAGGAIGALFAGNAYGQLPPTEWKFGQADRDAASAMANAVPEWQNPDIAHVGR